MEKETIVENQSEESKDESQGLDDVINTSESREILKYTTQAFNLNVSISNTRLTIHCMGMLEEGTIKSTSKSNSI